MRKVLVLLGGVMGLGCTPKTEPAAESPPPPPTPSPQEVLSAEMQAHGAAARTILDALVEGRLEAAQAAGRGLAERLPLPGLPEAPQAAVKAEAEALAVAPSVEVAALHFGQLSVACGGCHTAQGVTPHLPPPAAPPAAEGFTEQMQRYHWAAERMWQGLVLPSEAAFHEARAQLNALPTAPFRPAGVDDPVWGAETLDTVLHEQAQKLGPGDGAAYGAVLLMCAACHEVSPESPAHD